MNSFTENTTKKIAKFEGKFTQGNAVYLADNIACALMAQPVGNMGGFSNLYLVIDNGDKTIGNIKSE